jgi:hypothetical protein
VLWYFVVVIEIVVAIFFWNTDWRNQRNLHRLYKFLNVNHCCFFLEHRLEKSEKFAQIIRIFKCESLLFFFGTQIREIREILKIEYLIVWVEIDVAIFFGTQIREIREIYTDCTNL